MGCTSSHLVENQVVIDAGGLGKDGSKASLVNFSSQYHLSKELGRGAFAKVHSCVGVYDGSEFAVKVMDLRSQENEDAVCRQKEYRAKREIAMLKLVRKQEHCVKLIGGCIEGPTAYIVMEKCESTLLEALQAASVNEAFYKKVFGQMLQALSSIHKLGIVHFDIKPDNFICIPGAVPHIKLCDFGLATNALVHGAGHTHGTAPFMAPEMLLGQVVNEKVDVWSFAVIVYVLLLGKFPYEPKGPSGQAMKDAIKAGTPEPDFKPRPGLFQEGKAPALTDLAVDFMTSLLNRNGFARKSAREALRHPWLRDPAEEVSSLPSLRKMLSSAKRVGAFSRTRKQRHDGAQPDSPPAEREQALGGAVPIGCDHVKVSIALHKLTRAHEEAGEQLQPASGGTQSPGTESSVFDLDEASEQLSRYSTNYPRPSLSSLSTVAGDASFRSTVKTSASHL